MRLVCVTIFSIMVLSLSCKKETANNTGWVTGIVEDAKDMNCGLPRLLFTADAAKVQAITGAQQSIRFIAKGLPPELNIQGKEVKVHVTKLPAEESFPCLTWGPNYPALKIIDGRGIE